MDNKLLIALIDSLVNEAVSKIKVIEGQRGPRGLKGKDGNDFDLNTYSDEIVKLIHNNLPPFELTDELREQLKGLDGKDGRDGKDFNFHDYSDAIIDLIKENIPPFELTDELREELRGFPGRNGRDGRDGEDFDFESYKDKITDIISQYISEIAPSLKLTFKDLSDDELAQLRGPRGQRGKPGKDFSLDEAKDTIEQAVADSVMALAPDLKLKFDDLTDSERESLKLKFKDLTDEEIQSLRGPRGQRGKHGQQGIQGEKGDKGDQGDQGEKGDRGDRGPIGPRGIPGLQGLTGLNGKDGRDGKDAPVITDIEVDQYGQDVSLVFQFDNGTEIRTDSFELPKPENIYNVYSSVVGSKNPFLLVDIPCDVSVYEKSFVYIGVDGIARNALATDIETSKVLGIVESKPTTTTCNIRIKGKSDQVFSGLITYQDYWLSPTIPGGYTVTKPNKYQGYCVNLGQATDDKTLFVDIGTRFINNDLMKTQALYNEVSVATSSVQTIFTKTVDPGFTLEIAQVKVNGENKGIYTLKIDGDIVEKVYTYYTDYKATLVYGDLVAEVGQVIELEVENTSTDTANFNGTLFFREYEL